MKCRMSIEAVSSKYLNLHCNKDNEWVEIYLHRYLLIEALPAIYCIEVEPSLKSPSYSYKLDGNILIESAKVHLVRVR